MKEITVTFSQEELKTLVQRVFVGEYILSSDEESVDLCGPMVLQKLLLAAKTNKAISGIEFDELYGQYLIPYDMEAELVEEIDGYNEDIFVDSLIEELVENDMRVKYAPRLIANMNEETYERLSSEIVEKYVREIESNGFKNLRFGGSSD